MSIDIELSEAGKFAKGLRELAEMYETYPGMPLPSEWARSFTIFNASPHEIVECAKARGAQDTRKEYVGDTFYLHKVFTGEVKLTFYTTREQVCTRVVVGTETIPEHIEPEKVIPAKVVPEQTREVVEWRCHPLLAPPDRSALPTGDASPEYDSFSAILSQGG